MLARMIGRIIETEDDVAEGAEHLAHRCPRMAHAYAVTGDLPLRRRADGFAELLNAIISQQVSVASAAAVQGRQQLDDGQPARHVSAGLSP